MKKILSLILLAASFTAQGQYDCDNHPAISANYMLPKSFGITGEYYTKAGLTAGIGVAYTIPQTYEQKQGVNVYSQQTNSLDLYAYAGYRLVQFDYLMSAFVNVGYTMGNVEKFQPFLSTKLLFPLDQKAVSVEPVYIFGRGITGKLSIHFKL